MNFTVTCLRTGDETTVKCESNKDAALAGANKLGHPTIFAPGFEPHANNKGKTENGTLWEILGEIFQVQSN